MRGSLSRGCRGVSGLLVVMERESLVGEGIRGGLW